MTAPSTTAATKKRCPHCTKTKPVAEFGKDAHNKDHLASWCRSCMSAYRKSRTSKPKPEPAPVQVQVAHQDAAAAARATQNAKRREQRAARKAEAAA